MLKMLTYLNLVNYTSFSTKCFYENSSTWRFSAIYTTVTIITNQHNIYLLPLNGVCTYSYLLEAKGPLPYCMYIRNVFKKLFAILCTHYTALQYHLQHLHSHSVLCVLYGVTPTTRVQGYRGKRNKHIRFGGNGAFYMLL